MSLKGQLVSGYHISQLITLTYLSLYEVEGALVGGVGSQTMILVLLAALLPAADEAVVTAFELMTHFDCLLLVLSAGLGTIPEKLGNELHH